jgi:restriction system protein
MTIPDFQSIMLPLLEYLSDKKEHSSEEIRKAMISHFKLTEQEVTEQRLSTGQQVMVNRVAWAEVYLKHASLVESPARARYKISERGLDLLKTNPPKINISFLRQLSPEFKTFHTAKKDKEQEQPQINLSTQTPEEQMEDASKQISNSLATDLLNKVKNSSPEKFELLTLDLLRAMGYGEETTHLGKSGDEGVDGVINEDALGLSKIYVQAKRWNGDTPVGRKELQAFVGALHGKSNKGVFITTSRFTSEAIEYARNLGDKSIILIDGDQLARYMIKYKIGVEEKGQYLVYTINQDFFSEE